VSKDGTVTFTPVGGEAGLAGTTNTTTVTFTTDPATADPKEITFSRVVPARWDTFSAVEGATTLSNNSYISPAATTVTLAAKANLIWWGRVENGEGEVYTAGPVTGYQSKSVDLDFSARLTDDKDSWDTDKAVTVQAGYNTQGEIPGQTTKTLPLKRRPYKLDVTAGIATFNSVPLTVDTDAPDYTLEFKAGSATGGFITSYSGNGPSPTVNLPYNATAREVYVTNKYGREDEWLYHFNQPADNYYYAVKVASAPTFADVDGGKVCPLGYVLANEIPETHSQRVLNGYYTLTGYDCMIYSKVSDNEYGYLQMIYVYAPNLWKWAIDGGNVPPGYVYGHNYDMWVLCKLDL
jgi:hypothetical protein